MVSFLHSFVCKIFGRTVVRSSVDPTFWGVCSIPFSDAPQVSYIIGEISNQIHSGGQSLRTSFQRNKVSQPERSKFYLELRTSEKKHMLRIYPTYILRTSPGGINWGKKAMFLSSSEGRKCSQRFVQKGICVYTCRFIKVNEHVLSICDPFMF